MVRVMAVVAKNVAELKVLEILDAAVGYPGYKDVEDKVGV